MVALRWSAVALIAFSLLGVSVVWWPSTLRLWIGLIGGGTAAVYFLVAVTCPRYIAFLTIGTANAPPLWHRDTWTQVVPLVDELIRLADCSASIVWYPPRQSSSSELKWSQATNERWTHANAEERGEAERFVGAYIYCPARRHLLKKRWGMPEFYFRIGNLEFEGRLSKATQYCVILARRRFHKTHSAAVDRLVSGVASLTGSPLIATLQTRLATLNCVESMDFDPIYPRCHLEDFPSLKKMRLPWKRIHI